MKKLITTLLLVVLCWSGAVFPQSYNVTIRNQRAAGSDFVFDIYVRLIEPVDFYLSGSDFSLYFNNNFFYEPIASVQNSEDLQFYTSAITILNSNIIVLNILPPFFSDQQEFEAIAAKISSIEPGTRIAEITISGIINFSGDAGLNWKEQIPNQCVIYSFDNSSPWLTTEKTFIGEFILPTSTPLPVELSSFTATVNGNNVELNWVTEMEINNYGFEVERQVYSLQSTVSNFIKVGFVDGSGNSNSQKQYFYADKNLSSGNYSYRLKQIDNDGTFSFSEIINVDVNELPKTFALEQNYPNPFNPSTSIQYAIGSSQFIQLKVYDVLGTEIATLVNEEKNPGTYEVEFPSAEMRNNLSIPSGVYFYKFQSGNFVVTKKMTMLK